MYAKCNSKVIFPAVAFSFCNLLAKTISVIILPFAMSNRIPTEDR